MNRSSAKTLTFRLPFILRVRIVAISSHPIKLSHFSSWHSSSLPFFFFFAHEHMYTPNLLTFSLTIIRIIPWLSMVMVIHGDSAHMCTRSNTSPLVGVNNSYAIIILEIANLMRLKGVAKERMCVLLFSSLSHTHTHTLLSLPSPA